MTHTITLIHASRASIAPLNEHYSRHAPELELTNLLDDGLLRLFRAPDKAGVATRRLAEMIATARDVYSAELVLLACSAVPPDSLRELRHNPGLPVLKIDEPMAQAAVAAAKLIGVIVTFPPTLTVIQTLLLDAAAGKPIEILAEVIPGAMEAVLAGDLVSHDRLLTAAAGRLAARKAEAIVLAQVSMAHLVDTLTHRTGRPVFSSLETSLSAVLQQLHRTP